MTPCVLCWCFIFLFCCQHKLLLFEKMNMWCSVLTICDMRVLKVVLMFPKSSSYVQTCGGADCSKPEQINHGY